MNIIIIVGEAATKIMDRFPEFVRRCPQIRWQSMRGMRNRMAHGYAEVNLETVWRTLQEALPELLRALPEAQRAAREGE